jgi:hypothetical protein
MKKLLTGLFIFFTPVFIFLSIPTYILWHSKENFYKIDNLLTGKGKYLIGYVYNESNYHYLKWFDFKTNARKEIWTLGSSRVLPFRKQMFDSSFYNGGYTVSNVKDFRNILKSIPPDKYPKYLIIGLDQWMFNAAWNGNLDYSGWQHDFKFYPSLPETYEMVYNDLFAGKYKHNFIRETNYIQRIGINSIFNDIGFRNDGSMYWGKPGSHNNGPNRFSDAYSRIKQGVRLFEYGYVVSEQTLIELNELLKYCRRYQIEVIAFLPPYSDEIYNVMIKSKKYPYLTGIYPKVKPLFDKYHYEVYDFSNVSLCNSNDQEVTDGYHGGEITYQRLLIKILRSGSVLNRLTNVERLSADLSKKKNNLILYDY